MVKLALYRMEDQYSMLNLFDIMKLNGALKKISKGKRARTVQSYITAIERFLGFYSHVLSSREAPFFTPPGVTISKPDVTRVPQLINSLKAMSSSFN